MEQMMMEKRFTQERVEKAMKELKDFKSGKANLEAKIVSNEQWWKLQHWGEIKEKGNGGDPQPTSAWLQNTIANRHADAMDNYPEPAVLPRAEDDNEAAGMMSKVLPVVLEQAGYEGVYSDAWWYKLKHGTSVQSPIWDAQKDNGVGDITIRNIDLLKVYWQPGVTDIQDSRGVYVVDVVDHDVLSQKYPVLQDAVPDMNSIDVTEYIYDDSIARDGKTAVIDYYYRVAAGGRTVLHYAKLAIGKVLYCTEDDPEYAERGLYDHGKYPFVFDTLFPVGGSIVGYGLVDICRSPQAYIDKLDQAILKNAIISARPRWFVRGDGRVNEAEYADFNRDFVHFHGSAKPSDDIQPIEYRDVSPACINVRDAKVNELKETSGNRDFNAGGTASGVTAASAIAALQEAGSKQSRDMIKASYRSFTDVCYLCIDLMRQFYDETRYFRIKGEDGSDQFVEFNNTAIAPQKQKTAFDIDMGARLPIFDIKVASQRKDPFSTVAENERAMTLFKLGFFAPQNTDMALAALEMMQFEGKDRMAKKLQENGTLLMENQQLKDSMVQMATIIDAQNGTNIAGDMVQQFLSTGQMPQAQAGSASSMLGSTAEGFNRSFNEAEKQGRTSEARKAAIRSALPQ